MDERRSRVAPWVTPAVDGGLAVLCAAVGLGVLVDLADEDPRAWPAVVAWSVLIAAGGVAVGVRRRWPARSFAAVLAVGGIHWALAIPLFGYGLTLVVVTYSLAALAPLRPARVGVIALLAAVTAHQLATWWVDGVSFAGNLAVLAAAWLLGDAARRRRAESEAHAARARALEEAQQELARRAVAEERLRIARELHDVVAHSLSVIAINAGTGRLAFDRDPDTARAAVDVIEATCRDTLAEMRRLLGLLRADGAPPRAPLPTLAGLEDLVRAVDHAGLAVDLRVEGGRMALPPIVELTAYRVVQEALTNVVRHAGTDRAAVTVCYGTDSLVIEVTNPAGPTGARRPHGDTAGSRVGLVGMHERVASCGGILSAGPTTAGGFRVAARLPLVDGRAPLPAGGDR